MFLSSGDANGNIMLLMNTFTFHDYSVIIDDLKPNNGHYWVDSRNQLSWLWFPSQKLKVENFQDSSDKVDAYIQIVCVF
jgi:hypothetical protein